MAEVRLKPDCGILLIGGSAGSLGVIISILQLLRSPAFPVVIILHRKGAADSMLAGLLSAKSDLPVKEAEEKDLLEPGVVYIAPPDYHLLFESDGTVSLDVSEKINFSRPSIDVSFESAAAIYGPRLVAVLLSGGNNDGGMGLLAARRAGALTIVQDPKSAEVDYMPIFAISVLAAEKVMDASRIPSFLSLL